MMKVSVIVTTYNWPEALELVLKALDNQTYKDYEVIVADDGSKSDTQDLINTISESVSYPLVHVWHEDSGFRAAAIRNRAAAKAKGELLIFLDGDSIPFSYFIQRHMSFSEAGFFSAGNRILFRENFTKQILADKSPVYQWKSLKWISLWFSKKINRLLPLITLPDWSFRKYRGHKWRGVRTCNMSCWKKDFYNINGFDESYQGWGREDSDLAIRLINSGVLRKDVRYAIPVLHLWHQENDRAQLEQNDERLNKAIESGKIRADIGLEQY